MDLLLCSVPLSSSPSETGWRSFDRAPWVALLLVPIVAVLLPSSAYAQDSGVRGTDEPTVRGALRGTVIDSVHGDPLPGANVTLLEP